MKSLITLTTIVGGSIFSPFNTDIESPENNFEIIVEDVEVPTEPILVKPKRIHPILVKPKIKRKTIDEIIEEAEDKIAAWDDMVQGVKFFEGYKPKPYKCSAGVTTIGYGHTGKYAKTKSNVSRIEAEAMLLEELDEARNHVLRIVKVPLNDAQLAALTSFTFNAGQGNLRLLVNQPNRLNSGNYESVERMLPKYNKGGGRTLKGLTKRRNWEKELWTRN